MLKPTEVHTPMVEAARATAGTLGSALDNAAFQAEADMFPNTSHVLGAIADRELFGLPPDPLGFRGLHIGIHGLDRNQADALIASGHFARREGVWATDKLASKYTLHAAAMGLAGYFAPDQAIEIMDEMRKLNTHPDTGRIRGEGDLIDKASGAPHKAMEVLVQLAEAVSSVVTPLHVIQIANKMGCEPVQSSQIDMRGDMRRAIGLRTGAVLLGGIFGGMLGSPVCLAPAIVTAVHGLTRKDMARLDEVIGGSTPIALQAWNKLWMKNPEIVAQFAHHVGINRADARCQELVPRTDLNPDRARNELAKSISPDWFNGLKDVLDTHMLIKSVESITEKVSDAAINGQPLSNVFGLLYIADAQKREMHRLLPPAATDLLSVFGAIGDELSTAVKNAPQGQKLILALPVMMRAAIGLTGDSNNLFKTTGDTAVKEWSLTGYDDPLIKAYMRAFNADSFQVPVTDYIEPKFQGFDPIVAQKYPPLDRLDLGVIASFAKGTSHVTNMLKDGKYVVDPNPENKKPISQAIQFVDSRIRAEAEVESTASVKLDPAEIAKRSPSSPDNIFTAMMALSALKYYRNRADILQNHFVTVTNDKTELDEISQKNKAFFDAARNNLDLAARNIIGGIIKYSLENVGSVKSITSSSQAGDDWVPVKTLFTFMDLAQREFPDALKKLVAKPLESMLSKTGQSGTAEPWSSQIALFMGRIANQNRFGAALQKTARDHLVTMLKDTLDHHLSPNGKDVQGETAMPSKALSTLDILEDVLDPNQLDDEHKMIVLESIERYLIACIRRTPVSIAAEHAGKASSHPSQVLIQARNDAISKALDEVEKIIKAFKQIPTDAPSIGKLCQNIARLRPATKT